MPKCQFSNDVMFIWRHLQSFFSFLFAQSLFLHLSVPFLIITTLISIPHLSKSCNNSHTCHNSRPWNNVHEIMSPWIVTTDEDWRRMNDLSEVGCVDHSSVIEDYFVVFSLHAVKGDQSVHIIIIMIVSSLSTTSSTSWKWFSSVQSWTFSHLPLSPFSPDIQDQPKSWDLHDLHLDSRGAESAPSHLILYLPSILATSERLSLISCLTLLFHLTTLFV